MENITEKNKSLYNTASILAKHYEKFYVIFPKLSNMELGDVTGIIPTIRGVLDRIWKDGSINPPDGYPEGRMANLFKIISKALGSRIEQEFTEREPDGNFVTNVWEKSFSA